MNELNQNTIQDRSEWMLKSFGVMDRTHGGKLHEKVITDRRGHKETKWVKNEDRKTSVTSKSPQWWDNYKQYKLNAYPVNIPQEDVQTNTTGDINSHWVLRWTDPKTKALKTAYTHEFLQRNAQVKWERVQNITDKEIRTIKNKSLTLLSNESESTSTRDAAAIINIIAHTGLRRGNKLKYKVTGNRGVSTLNAENIKIEGNTVRFNFTGKSYKENNAKIVNKKLAEYLREHQTKGNDNGEFLFQTSDETIDKIFDQVGGSDLKIKDMRTYVATDLAKDILFNDKTPPPPLENLPKSKQKRLIQNKLKLVFEKVSQALNNTPSMARVSYIHPAVIDNWLKQLNIDFDIKKALGSSIFQNPSLEKIKRETNYNSSISGKINSNDEDECNQFNLPDWWSDDEIVQKAFDNLC